MVMIHSMAVLASGYSGVWAYIKLILVFVFILLLAYYGAKLAGNYQNNALNSKTNIKIIESYRIGGNKLLAIAKIGEDFYAIGIGKDEITLIDKLDASYFNGATKPQSTKPSFGKTFGNAFGKKANFKDILKNVKNNKSNESSEGSKKSEGFDFDDDDDDFDDD